MKTTTTLEILKSAVGNPLTRSILKGMSKYCEKDGKNRIEVAVELYTGQRENACLSCRTTEKIIANVLKKCGEAFGLNEKKYRKKYVYLNCYYGKPLCTCFTPMDIISKM